MRNLKTDSFKQKDAIIDQIYSLGESANDAYDRSMLILLAGWLGEVELYDMFHERMLSDMSEENFPNWVDKDNSFAFMAWMSGRMCVAAEAMGVDYTVRATQAREAAYEHIAQQSKPNAMTAWAYAYILMNVPDGEYQAQKGIMIAQAKAVHKKYGKALKVPEMPEEKTARLDVLWTWTMVAQAAAHHQDQGIYRDALASLAGVLLIWQQEVSKTIFHETARLPNVLLAALDPKGYHTWLLANLLDAQKRINLSVFSMENLEPVFQEAIALPGTTKQDNLLGQVVRALAIAQHPQQRPGISNPPASSAPPDSRGARHVSSNKN